MTPTDRFQWLIKESFVIAAILLFWNAIAIVASVGIGNIGVHGPGNMFTGLGNTIANAAVQVGLIAAVMYMLVRAGVYLIDYHNA